MDAAGWNKHYATIRQHWTAPNPWVYSEMNGARAGTALDLGAGDGRHAVWLAERGWQVEAVDFSMLGLEIGKRRAEANRVQDRISWTMADVTAIAPVPGSIDLVLVAYLNLPEPRFKKVFAAVAGALAPGGRLLFINHDAGHLRDGLTVPPDASALLTPEQVAGWMRLAGLHIDTAETVSRPVPGERQPAYDCLVTGSAAYTSALATAASAGPLPAHRPTSSTPDQTMRKASL